MDLLSTDAFGKFQELCDLYVFDTEGDENCREDWGSLIKECDPEDEEMDASDYARQIEDRNDFYESSIDERARRIAFDQLKAWSMYVEDKPLAKAAYHDFLVSVSYFLHAIAISLSYCLTLSFSTGAIQP